MRKKRWTIKLALCLLAGAVVTWGVAWGCALWAPSPFHDGWSASKLDQTFGPPPPTDGVTLPELQRKPEVLHEVYECSNRFCTYWMSTRWGPDGEREESQYRFGWPVRAMVGKTESHAPWVKSKPWPRPAYLVTTHWSSAEVREERSSTWLRLPDCVPRKHSFIMARVPAAIIPAGFVLNTLVTAALLFAVTEVPRFARRRLRRAKGRCPSCGYDRAGLAEGSACPECGGKA